MRLYINITYMDGGRESLCCVESIKRRSGGGWSAGKEKEAEGEREKREGRRQSLIIG